MLLLAAAATATEAQEGAATATDSPQWKCQQNMMTDTDIDPHTPGMGSIAASTIDTCCTVCASRMLRVRTRCARLVRTTGPAQRDAYVESTR